MGRRRRRQKAAVARTKEVRERGEKRRSEWRSESKGLTACRGYCDGNVIRKSDCGARGSVQVTPSASNLG